MMIMIFIIIINSHGEIHSLHLTHPMLGAVGCNVRGSARYIDKLSIHSSTLFLYSSATFKIQTWFKMVKTHQCSVDVRKLWDP